MSCPIRIDVYHHWVPPCHGAKRLELTVKYGPFTLIGEHIMATDLKVKEFAEFEVKALNDAKPGVSLPTDGPITLVVTGETSVDVFFDAATRKGKVGYLDAGPWRVDFTADADLTAGERFITSSISGTNAPLEATSLVVEVGPIQTTP